ncbi:hypothetical protein HDU86_006492 [Geranomyces michiganensis]|nr:hypothetical protein HDU86_006492 [Geranomyces michiganensis]
MSEFGPTKTFVSWLDAIKVKFVLGAPLEQVLLSFCELFTLSIRTLETSAPVGWFANFPDSITGNRPPFCAVGHRSACAVTQAWPKLRKDILSLAVGHRSALEEIAGHPNYVAYSHECTKSDSGAGGYTINGNPLLVSIHVGAIHKRCVGILVDNGTPWTDVARVYPRDYPVVPLFTAAHNSSTLRLYSPVPL